MEQMEQGADQTGYRYRTSYPQKYQPGKFQMEHHKDNDVPQQAQWTGRYREEILRPVFKEVEDHADHDHDSRNH